MVGAHGERRVVRRGKVLEDGAMMSPSKRQLLDEMRSDICRMTELWGVCPNLVEDILCWILEDRKYDHRPKQSKRKKAKP